MKFSKESFALLGLPDLLLNIWSYAHSKQPEISIQYTKLCIELVSECWLDGEYLDFGFVINSIIDGNRNFCDFGKIASCDKDTIFDIIKK